MSNRSTKYGLSEEKLRSTIEAGGYVRSKWTHWLGLPTLKAIGKAVGMRAPWTDRRTAANAIINNVTTRDVVGGITRIMEIAQGIRSGSRLDPADRELIGLAKRRDWKTIIKDYSISAISAAFNRLDRLAHGDYVLMCNITVTTPVGGFEPREYKNIAVRSRSPEYPTDEEMLEALIVSGRVGQYERRELMLREGGNRENPLISTFEADVMNMNEVTPQMDWRERRHKGAVLSYITTTKSFFQPTNGILKDEIGYCAYQIIKEDLGIDRATASAMIGRAPELGVLIDEMVTIYKSVPRTIYCFGLDMNQFASHVIPTEEATTEASRIPVVLIFANQHVYRPNAETRKNLLSTTMDKKTYDADDGTKERKDMEDDAEIIFVPSVEEAMKRDEAIRMKQLLCEAPIIGMKHESRIDELKDELGELEKGAPRTNAGREMVRAAKREMKIKIKAIKEECKTEKKVKKIEIKEQRPVRIYVPKADLTFEYRDFLTQGDVYMSDISPSGDVTQFCPSYGVTVFANENYAIMKKTAEQLGIRKYINQSTANMARTSFKAFRGNKWRSSVLNNGIADLLEQYPPLALNLVNNVEIDKKTQELAGVDFYRHYTSVAVCGGFYTAPLVTDIETYTDDEIGDEPYLYYVEPPVSDAASAALGGNGVYDYKVVLDAIHLNIIELGHIKLKIRMNAEPELDKIIREWIEHIYKNVTNDTHRKELVNTLLGALKADHRFKGRRSVIVADMPEASYYYNTFNKSVRSICPLIQCKGDMIYLVSGADKATRRKTDELIRRAVIQRARMATYKLMLEVAKDHVVALVRTDAVYYVKNIDARGVDVSARPGFGGRRLEKPKGEMEERVKFEKVTTGHDERKYHLTKQKWRQPIKDISSTEYFDKYDALMALDRAYIRGRAGTGKTYVLNEFKAQLEAEKNEDGTPKLRVVSCAFTHAAARLIKGGTAHKLLGINKMGTPCEQSIRNVMENVDVVLIDEVSMIPAAIYTILSQLPRKVKIFATGDFCQHKPVEEDNTDGRLYCDTTMFKSLFNYNLVHLKKQCRADAEAADACQEFFFRALELGVPEALKDMTMWMHKGDDEPMPLVNICYTNKKRIQVNTACMNRECKYVSPIEDRVYKAYPKTKGARYTWEHYDAKKLYYVLTHQEEHKKDLESSRGMSSDAIVDMCSRYLMNSWIDADGIGHKHVEWYRCSEGRGRWVPDKSLSLANITRPIRRIIASERYVDIDCENCHPAILQWLCAHACPRIETPMLDKYIEDKDGIRNKVAGKLKISYELAKKMILATINGGRADQKKTDATSCKWMVKFTKEVEAIGSAFRAQHADLWVAHEARRRAAEKWEGADEGSFVNMFMLEKEVEIMEIMIREMANRRLLGKNDDDVVYCADGLMACKNIGIDNELLEHIAELVDDTMGMRVTFGIKPMTPSKTPAWLPVPKLDEVWTKFMDADLWDEFPKLCVGMPIIANDTKIKLGYSNNQTFKLINYTYDGLAGSLAAADGRRANMVLLADTIDDTLVCVENERFRRDFRPAYCTTSHKAQGQTIHEKYAIHEIDKMDAHGAYVSITRASAVANVMIFS